MQEERSTVATLGELERAVMDVIWDHGDSVTAYDVKDVLDGSRDRPPAVTTLLTVLSRLARKGLVESDRSARPHRYRAVASREDYIAELMHEVLRVSQDRNAVLARFVGGVSKDEAAALRSLLTGRG